MNRREFSKTAGILVAGAALTPKLLVAQEHHPKKFSMSIGSKIERPLAPGEFYQGQVTATHYDMPVTQLLFTSSFDYSSLDVRLFHKVPVKPTLVPAGTTTWIGISAGRNGSVVGWVSPNKGYIWRECGVCHWHVCRCGYQQGCFIETPQPMTTDCYDVRYWPSPVASVGKTMTPEEYKVAALRSVRTTKDYHRKTVRPWDMHDPEYSLKYWLEDHAQMRRLVGRVL